MKKLRIPGFVSFALRFILKRIQFFLGITLGFILVYLGYLGLHHTSTDDFCAICHVHPQAIYSWKRSTHYKNESGVVVHCVECHLPPPGIRYLTEKTRLGVRDAYGTMFKDTETIDWESKSLLDHAVTYTFDASCIKCHDDLYSLNLTPKGVKAHEYYMKTYPKIKCINCHITVGHFQEEPEEIDYLAEERYEAPVYPPDSGEFVNYTEAIPESEVSFNMVAIEGGTFRMGSPESEPYRSADEGPVREVTVPDLWIGEVEVTWREFDLYYERNKVPKREELEEQSSPDSEVAVDAVTGPTPPYGSPSQGWGKGSRPAITMTFHTAQKYCEWLSEITGNTYRLPTEAEWEYACRAGSEGAYYFDGDPKKLTERSLLNRIFGIDADTLSQSVWYAGNSTNKTQPVYANQPNPWGLYNMLGNVREYCLDWYSPAAYTLPFGDNPTGPSAGDEHVVRGGSYASDPADLRAATRDHTRHDAWLMTDPQSPKSIWWYSDVRDVGFRVVREFTTSGNAQ